VAGIFFLYKAAGAAAAAGASLDEVLRVATKAQESVRTMGVALSPCIVPEVGHASFSLGEKEMEIGMGIHGEPGIRRGHLLPADAVTDEMMRPILDDLPFRKGDEVAVLMNGLGGTPKEELYVMYRRVAQVLKDRGISAWHVWAGEFATSMEMAGLSISVMRLDAELKRLLAAPALTPFYEQAAIVG
jgi:dihydroxyacetone kinase-like protein